MTSIDIINQKVDFLFQIGLVDYIETTDNETYKQAISFIEKELSNIDFKSHKIQFLDLVNSRLRHHKDEHQKECPLEKDSICYFELHYDDTIKFCDKKKKKLILEQAMMSFDDKIKLILQELASTPNRSGDLEEILQNCDISYVENDLQEFVEYFGEKGYVSIGKNDIVLNQSGIDFLKEKPKKQTEQIIHIAENYHNSVVAKGNHINQSVESSAKPLDKYPTKKADNEISAVDKSQRKSSPPTKEWQKRTIIVSIILFILTCVFAYLMNKNII